MIFRPWYYARLTYMGLNGTITNGRLMVRVRDIDDMHAQLQGGGGRVPAAPVFQQDTSLLLLAGFTPTGFAHGIEVLNDNSTPMNFVVDVLQKHAGLDAAAAVRTMLEIHRKGGALVACESRPAANQVADAITSEAQRLNYPLLCRAVSA